MGCLKLAYYEPLLPMKIVYRRSETDKKSVQVFCSIDPLAEQRPHISPYAYCSNSPINRIDPTGMLDDEWQYNIDTKELTNVGSKGGTETQYVQITNNNEVDFGEAVVNGQDFFVYKLRDAVAVTNYDAHIPDDYNRNTGYEYSERDFMKRKEMMSFKSNPMQTYIGRVEREGLAEPIHKSEFYALYGYSLGNFIVGTSFLKMALDIVPSGSFPNTSPRGISLKASSFKPAGVTTAKELNSWNQFLTANKGKYSGKGWLHKATSDYYKSSFYKAGGQ